jgi:hypothetical protein
VIARLVRRNLAHHGLLLVALAVGVGALEALIAVLAARIEAGPGLLSLLAQLVPEGMRGVLMSQLEYVSFAGVVGFGFGHPVILVATVAFVVVATTIPPAERESGFLDLVLSRGPSRAAYVTAAAALAVVGSAVLPLAVLGGAAVGLALVEARGELPWTRYVASAEGLALLLLAIAGATLAISCGCKRRGPAVARAVGLVLALYVVETFADLWRPFGAIRWLSPFRYFRPVPAAISGSLRGADAAVLLGIFVAGVAVAVWRFRRSDV